MIINARIASVYLGFSREYNFKDVPFTLSLTLMTERGMTILGDYILDKETFDSKGRYKGREIDTNVGEIICGLLKIAGTDEWQGMSGQYIRCELADSEKFKIIRIGHILIDEWVDLSRWTEGGAKDERD